jgi:endo-1,4-beta-D-glucanase Y/4-amino-4-deoxy-L-arabinose transferase-like glycosyltransferase
MVVGFVAQGLNMFNYPAFTFKDDEGIYAGQTWAVLREGQLTPYTYFYDHAPAGWMLSALWTALTGGFFTFGGAIDSGRVLMLLLHLAMVPLLYRVARKLDCSVEAAALAAFIFSVSPLAIFYQRMFLLDTIMLFWVLLSLDLLLDGWGRLSRFILSGLCFGLALVSKETAIFLVPVMLLVVFQQRWKHQGRFAVVSWLLPMLAVLSWYPLYALLKGELLPAGQALGFSILNISSDSSHVSLVDALKWQASRTGGGFFNLDNMFWQLVRTDWMVRDPILFGVGGIACGINLLRGIRDRRALITGLLGLLSLLYLGRGGVVFDYYILFAIPFLALNLAVLVSPLLKRQRLPKLVPATLVALVSVGLVVFYLLAGTLQPLYTQRPAQAGRDAIAWIKQNIPSDSLIISRDDVWTDLREAGPNGLPAFPGIESHWKVAADPAIKNGVFHDSGLTADYLIMSPGLEAAFKDTNDTVALEALHNAQLVKSWSADSSELELWKVNKVGTTEASLLAGSAAYIAGRFEQEGALADAGGVVTSEAQSYALLRAAWTGDQATFEQIWSWTQRNLLSSQGLLAWKWQSGKVIDANSAADADTDTALALLMAGKRWNDPALLDAGKKLAQAIWQNEVVTIKDQPYMAAGNWATNSPVLDFNPSYFAPYAYNIFQQVDPGHNWRGLIDSGYNVLFEASSSALGAGKSAGLPPDWVGIDRESGKLVPVKMAQATTSTSYGYDATRTYWRIALHLNWTGDGRAKSFLSQAGFLADEVNRKGFVSAVYSHDGTVLEANPSVVSNVSGMAALLTLDPVKANRVYAGQLVGGSNRNEKGVYWSNPDDLYAQEWGWFGTALYAGATPDLWNGQTSKISQAKEVGNNQ